MILESITYGTIEIGYTILYSDRKTLGITVDPNGRVIVMAPREASQECIREKITKRALWIRKQQAFFKSFGEKMPDRKYISGETHLYLGKQYLLRVMEGKPSNVHIKGRCFEIVCNPKSKAGEWMKEWYKRQAKLKFAEIAEPIIQRFKKYKVEPSSIHIQHMSNRWGSCTPRGKIILNAELIKAPNPCIEYVITHELCHLVHRNHTRAFYDLLAGEMPDWERWKNKLESILY